MFHALFFAAILAGGAAAQSGPAWPEAKAESRPWTRWWWHGSAVNRDTLRTELDQFRQAGIGGVEITPIYGVKGKDALTIPYLSPEWLSMVGYTAAEAKKLGLGVDLTPGSGWRIGGPLVSEKYANASAKITRLRATGGSAFTQEFRTRAIQAVTAYPVQGAAIDLTGRIANGRLDWTPPVGEWTVFVLEKVWSGEKVKRPAPGGEGYTIDTYSKAAFDEFFQAFDQRIAAIPNGAVRAWFHDSFEYTGNWSSGMPQEFRQRRGYDIAAYLRELTGEGDPEVSARVLSDYRETLSELLRDNVIQPLAAWAKTHAGISRNQAHGSPGNLLDLYAACDIPETEIFGKLGGSDSDPLINKFASSAAHVTGKPLTSAESFTWLNEHFNETLGEMKRATDQMLLAGVNHMVFHGTAYSPPDEPWPGWVFYASSELNPRNPIWRDLPALTRYITRAQSVLQSGTPSNDLLLYWPYYDVIDNPGPMFQQLAVHSPAWFYHEPVGGVARDLWASGISFDYISDAQLRAAKLSGYKAILIPETRRMPADTLAALLERARGGATVIFHKRLPEDVPGLGDLEKRRARMQALKQSLRFLPNRLGIPEAALGSGRVVLATSLERALAGTGAVRETPDGVLSIRRAHNDGHSYFLVNAGSEPVDGFVSPNSGFGAAALMDPMTGEIGMATVAGKQVRVQLPPYASILLRTYTSPVSGAPWEYAEPAGPAITLSGNWQVRFLAGGPELPASYSTNRFESWTARGGIFESFAGTARYRLHFDAPPQSNDYWLDLGTVADSAQVRLNGRDLGTALLAPFRFPAGSLKSKENVLEIDVTNVAANRIRDLDRRKVEWRIFHDINFVNIRYQPFDASNWPVREAGLIGPVRLIPRK